MTVLCPCCGKTVVESGEDDSWNWDMAGYERRFGCGCGLDWYSGDKLGEYEVAWRMKGFVPWQFVPLGYMWVMNEVEL